MKVAIVTNIYTPYRRAQFSLFKEKFEQLSIYFSNNDLQDREWEKKNLKYYYTLKTVLSFGEYGKLNSGLIRIVKDNDFIIIGGYEQPTYIVLSILCRLFNKPYAILFDGISPKRVANYKKGTLKHLIKGLVIKNANAYFLNGQISKDYFLKAFNISDQKVYNQFLTIDNKLFLVKENKDSISKKVKEELNINNSQKVILFCGRLIKRKNIKSLIDVVAALGSEYVLLVMGNGPEYMQLKEYAFNNNALAIFIGNIKVEELYKYYYTSNLIVLPSYDEPWGLVINEAIICKKPVLVSNEVGCAKDLVVEGQNGYVFEIDNINDFKGKLEQALSIKKEHVDYCSELISKNWTLNKSAENFASLVKSVIRKDY